MQPNGNNVDDPNVKEPQLPNQANTLNSSDPLPATLPLNSQNNATTPQTQALNNPNQAKQQNIMTSNKSKPKILIGVIVLCILLFLLVAGVAAVLIGRSNDTTPTPAISSLSGSSRLSSSNIAFSIPIEVSGWEAELYNQNGTTQFVSNDKICQSTFFQNKATDTEVIPTPEQAVEGYIQEVRAMLGTNPIKVVGAEPLTLNSSFSGSKSYEFVGKSIQYTGNNSKDYTNTIHAYHQDTVQLLVVQACESDTWQSRKSDLQRLLEQVKVADQ